MEASEKSPVPDRQELLQQAKLAQMFEKVKGIGQPTEEMLIHLWEHLEPAQVTKSLKNLIVERYTWYASNTIEPIRKTLVFEEELFFLGNAFAGGVFSRNFHQRLKLEKIGFGQTLAQEGEFGALGNWGINHIPFHITESQKQAKREKWYQEHGQLYEFPLILI